MFEKSSAVFCGNVGVFAAGMRGGGGGCAGGGRGGGPLGNGISVGRSCVDDDTRWCVE